MVDTAPKENTRHAHEERACVWVAGGARRFKSSFCCADCGMHRGQLVGEGEKAMSEVFAVWNGSVGGDGYGHENWSIGVHVTETYNKIDGNV